jgi:hypothetical protein
MIPKSGYRFSEKIMLQQEVKARRRFEEKSSRFSRSIVTRTFGKAADLFPILRRVLLNPR